MALENEKNVDLAFDTVVLKECGDKYEEKAKELLALAKELDDCLATLKSSGWTTPAGSAFHEMVSENWRTNIEKYADLLTTLKSILHYAVGEYETLTSEYIQKTKIRMEQK